MKLIFKTCIYLNDVLQWLLMHLADIFIRIRELKKSPVANLPVYSTYVIYATVQRF